MFPSITMFALQKVFTFLNNVFSSLDLFVMDNGDRGKRPWQWYQPTPDTRTVIRGGKQIAVNERVEGGPEDPGTRTKSGGGHFASILQGYGFEYPCEPFHRCPSGWIQEKWKWERSSEWAASVWIPRFAWTVGIASHGMSRSADYPTHVVDGNRVHSLSVYDNLVYRVSHASEIVNQGIAAILSLISPFDYHCIEII